VVLGGAVGLERELRGKAAGLRTNILICVGATLFTVLSVSLAAGGWGDPARIAAQIVTGVGFLGAGTILHARGAITGLTSAATIWVVAAIGVALGTGAVYEAAGATLLMLFVLRGLGWVEGLVKRGAAVSHLRVEVDRQEGEVERVEAAVVERGLVVEEMEVVPVGDRLQISITMRGPKRQHDLVRLALLRATSSFKLSALE